MLDKWQAEAEAFKAEQEAATAGEWYLQFGGNEGDDGYTVSSKLDNEVVAENYRPIPHGNEAADGTFIVHARNSPIADYLLTACKRVEELVAQWSCMARACGNWRTWPGEAEGDHDHADWRAASRAILERDELKQRVAELEASRSQVGYRCGQCGSVDCKLWRVAATSHIELTCWECLEAKGHTITLAKSDQVYDSAIEPFSYVPAVPDFDGQWWGYTSVPQWWVKWWRALPDRRTTSLEPDGDSQ